MSEPVPTLSEEELARRKRRRAEKAAERKHKREVEDPEINIVAMMDMMTIILVYLLKSYSSDPVQITPGQGTELPQSTTQLPPTEAIQLAISDRFILVNDRMVARVSSGRVDPEFKRDRNPAQMFIPALHDALKAEGDRQKLFARYNKARKELEFKGLLTIIGDKRVPFRLLTEVLYTAGQAEFGQYKFAVIKKESS